jgi:hypothetical protein
MMNLGYIGWGGVGWIDLAQDRDKWKALVNTAMKFHAHNILGDRLCGLVVTVLGYRSGGPGSIPSTTKKKSSGSGTGSTQPREYN